MNAVSIRAPKACLLTAQSNADLWVMLGHCDGTVARLEDQLNDEATFSLRYNALQSELAVWRAEQTKVADELKGRLLSWCGGVDLNAFVERLG